jgi:hypothetical protein
VNELPDLQHLYLSLTKITDTGLAKLQCLQVTLPPVRGQLLAAVRCAIWLAITA